MYNKPIVLYSGSLDQIDNNLTNLMQFLGLSFETISVEDFVRNKNFIKKNNGNTNINILISMKSTINLLKCLDNKAVSILSLISKLQTMLIYGIDSNKNSCHTLQTLTENKNLSISQFNSNNFFYEINEKFKGICGPFAGLSLGPVNNKIDYGIHAENNPNKITSFVSIGGKSLFIKINKNSCDLYFIACKNILNIADMVSDKLDINKCFSQIIPVIMYLRNTFRDICWNTNRHYACLIIDDPLIVPKYGFLNYKTLLNLMEKYGFHTNIAFIPWNYKRSDPIISKIIKKNPDKFTICVHGCDHTQNEFGSNNLSELNKKVQLAKRRMRIHYEKTGIQSDNVMICPQGIFSSEAIEILKLNNFLACVNTDVLPYGQNSNGIEISQLLQLAITKYNSFPVFNRRYPDDGIENFAFDIFMGKPCLIVVHHGFFKHGYEELINLIQKINTMENNLVWKGLHIIANNIHQWKNESKEIIKIKMFTNNLILKNPSNDLKKYKIIKEIEDFENLKNVTIDDKEIKLNTNQNYHELIYESDPNKAINIKVLYNNPYPKDNIKQNTSYRVKVTTRRFLSEFRDNYLSKNDSILGLATKLKNIIS